MKEATLKVGQLDLFGGSAATPDGLRHQDGLLSAKAQVDLVSHIAALPFKPFEFHGRLGNRRIASFGVRYDYSREATAPAPAFPEFLLQLRVHVAAFAGLQPEQFGQALVTEYAPGAGIGWHRDKAVFGEVAGVSLVSACDLRFRRAQPLGGWERCAVHLQPGSVYLLQGPSRTQWEHSITPVERLRYSITFRRYAGPGAPSL